MENKVLKCEPGVYVPDAGISYPEDNPYTHLVKVETAAGEADRYTFDENYPYIDNSLKFKWNKFLGFLFMWGICAPWNRLKYGLRIRGRKQLRQYRKELSEGAVCICNHVYTFDALCVYQAVQRFGWLWIPMYAKHFNGKQSWKLRHMGGIPVAETVAGMRKFNEAFDEYHRRKDWILVFPEEVRWNFYKPIRPFRKGAFTMAYKYDIPVVPLVITYRERTGIYKLFGKAEEPLMTITAGAPVRPDRSHTRKEEVDSLRIRLHETMEKMAGIASNPWPAIPDDELKAHA